jgi:hypothetical protein
MLTADRIRHQVVFTLKPDADEADFLRAIAELEAIPGVEAFELMREVSPKNGYEHALTMEFADKAAYEAYNAHPQHAGFVENRWDNEVADFLEIDTVAR